MHGGPVAHALLLLGSIGQTRPPTHDWLGQRVVPDDWKQPPTRFQRGQPAIMLLSPSGASRLGNVTVVVSGTAFRDLGDVKVRFFGIFSTTGRSTYSCNVSATGRVSDGQVTITKLSCAKDEGWGRTFDII